MKWLKHFMLFLYCFVNNNICLAQTIEDFKKIEGLNSNVVYCTIQDSKGFIWAGTEAGVVRYDGHKLIHYTIDDGLTDNDVFQIHEDSKGRLWFLTNNGGPCIYENGKILNAFNTSWLRNIQPRELASYFFQQSKNNIWFCTLDTAYHFINDKVVEKIAGYAKGNILATHIYMDTMYILQSNGVYNVKVKELYAFPLAYSIENLRTKAYAYNDKIYYFNKNKLNCFSLQSKTASLIYETQKDNQNLVFIPTPYKDIVFFSNQTTCHQLNASAGTISATPILNYPYITAYFKDLEGNSWLSSLQKGLFIQQNALAKKTIKLSPNFKTKSTKSSAINIIGNTAYIGFDYENYLIIKDGSIIEHPGLSNSNDNTFSQFFKHNNLIWPIKRNNLVIQYHNKNRTLPYSVKYVTENKSAIYLATSTGVLKLMKKDIPSIVKEENYFKYFKAISNQKVSRILSISNDSLFAGGSIGLQLFVNEKTAIPLSWNIPITKGLVSKIVKAKTSDIVFTTNNLGLGIIHADTIYTIDRKKGLLSNTCNSVYVAENNELWIATAKGVNKIKYTIHPNKSIHYLIEDYSKTIKLGSNFINDVALYKDTLILSTQDGAYLHFLSKQINQDYLPTTYIESILANNAVYEYQSDFKFRHNQNRIKINFIGLSFQKDRNITYRYKLLPVDTTWHYTEMTSADYPFLEPGEYKFLVTAKLDNGNFNKIESSVQINITPPFYKTTWFLIIVFFLLSAITYWGIRYWLTIQKQKLQTINNTLRLEKENAIKEREKIFFEKQAIELEQKALGLQMNPHFLFNALNAIKGLYSADDKTQANAYTDKFSNLMRLILEKNSLTNISLYDEINICELYLELALLRLDKKFEYHIHVANNLNTINTYILPMLIQPFIENAVIHGISSMEKGGRIDIFFKIEKEFLIININDNGIGFEKSQTLQKYKIKQSKGIEITRQRLLLLSQKSSVVIKQTRNEETIVCGTKIVLTIPLLEKE